MNKNDIYEVRIEDVTEEGLGVGRADGMAVFVKDTAPGDLAKIKIVKVKKSYAYGRLEEIITPSSSRVEPVCSVARQCGGCTLQHISYESELELKKNKVLNVLRRIGGIEEPEKYLEGVYGVRRPAKDEASQEYCPYRYRNKMQFPVGIREGKPVLGFYAGRTHDIIPISDCYIGHDINKNIIEAVASWIEKCNITVYDENTGKGLLRHVLTRVGFETGELMVCIVISGRKMVREKELIEFLRKAVEEYSSDNSNDIDIKLTSVVYNINTKKTNKILGDETKVIYGSEYITDYIGNTRFAISAQSFYQVNPIQTEKLYGKALEYAGLTGDETVWDMYCGIGTISLFLAKKARKVYGVEIVPQAIEDARRNAELNGLTNVEFYVGKAEEVVPRWYEEINGSIDVVVVDPPRKGCDEKLLDTIVRINPKKLVYVSCDPATLARDIKYLSDYGWKLSNYSIYDQFSRSMHVETVTLLTT